MGGLGEKRQRNGLGLKRFIFVLERGLMESFQGRQN